MRVEMTKTKRTLCLIALMLTNLAVMNDLVIIPIISSFYQNFGDHMGLVNYIVSGHHLLKACANTHQGTHKRDIIGIFHNGAEYGPHGEKQRACDQHHFFVQLPAEPAGKQRGKYDNQGGA